MRWLVAVAVVIVAALGAAEMHMRLKATRARHLVWDGDPVVFVGTPGDAQPGGATGGDGSVTCGMYEVPGVNGAGVSLGVGDPAVDPVEGRPYVVVCRNADGVVVYQRVIIYQPNTVTVDAATLAAPGVSRTAAPVSTTVHRSPGQREPTRRRPHVVLDRSEPMATA